MTQRAQCRSVNPRTRARRKFAVFDAWREHKPKNGFTHFVTSENASKPPACTLNSVLPWVVVRVTVSPCARQDFTSFANRSRDIVISLRKFSSLL